MYISIVLLFFIVGTIFGSFYNVVGYRLPNKMSLISPPSHCTKCNHRLTPLELIPIFSFIFLGGKCKKCKSKISLFYPIIEFLSGILFSLSFIKYGLTLECLLSIIFISMLLIIIVSDYLTMTIPDSVLIFFCLCILILKSVITGIDNIPLCILEGIGSFIFMLLLKLLGDFLFKKESMGFGDIKLMFVFGITIGFFMSIVSVFLSSFIALPISLLTIKSNNTHEIPFGPYLAIAAIIIMLSGINFNDYINLITI